MNPLLKPGDPRFQRPPLRDGAGNNVFADPDAPVPAEPADGQPLAPMPRRENADNLFAPPSAMTEAGPVYQPQYETTHAHRSILLLGLAIVGLAGDGALLLIFTGSIFGIAGLAAIVPAGIAFLLGRSDLAAMRQGAVDPAGRRQTLVAMWLGLAGALLYFAILAVAAAFIGLIVRLFVQNG
jgi:hypothetical protein